MKKTSSKIEAAPAPAFGTPAYVERFGLMARRFTEKYSTKEAAIKLMKREGILDSKGNLTKNYSPK